jgi:hypothetical protein
VPGFTVTTGFLKVKLSIATAAAGGAGAALVTTDTVESSTALDASAAACKANILNARVMFGPLIKRV